MLRCQKMNAQREYEDCAAYAALRAQLAEVTRERDQAREELRTEAAATQVHRHVAQNARTRATAAEADAAAAREQVRKLREALRPFADALSRYPTPPYLIGLINDDTGARLNVLHVDAFHTALALQGEGKL